MDRLQSLGLAVLLLANAGRCASAHPLDPLSAAEIRTVFATLRGAGYSDFATRYALIDLDEPVKREVLAWEPGKPFVRRAFVIARRDLTVYEAVVDLSAQRVERWQAIRDGQVCVEGRTVTVHVDGDGTPAPLPPALRDLAV